jgi:hypothetical protein
MGLWLCKAHKGQNLASQILMHSSNSNFLLGMANRVLKGAKQLRVRGEISRQLDSSEADEGFVEPLHST